MIGTRVSSLTLITTTISLHISSLFLLSFCQSSTQIHPQSSKPQISAIQLATTINGLVAGSLTICLPYLMSLNDPAMACGLFIVCFFYGCKILDLAVARARSPPVLIQAGQPEPLDSLSTRLKYVWLLLTETRYAAFDIAVRQKERDGAHSSMWTFGPPIAIPLLVYMVPTPETKSIAVMLIIQLGLDGLHAIFHPLCPSYLFWRPFAASSLTSFWRTHWHAGAETFLRSLAYAPVKELALRIGLGKDAARAMGVVAAFNLSGIWHGWATAILATRPWMVGLRVWSLFVSMGVGVVMESLIPKRSKGSMAQRLFVWAFVMLYAGWAWRGLQANCKVPWLANI